MFENIDVENLGVSYTFFKGESTIQMCKTSMLNWAFLILSLEEKAQFRCVKTLKSRN